MELYFISMPFSFSKDTDEILIPQNVVHVILQNTWDFGKSYEIIGNSHFQN